jgi:NADPH-dependent 2,4-dienoyl-CoA reductase/sulfur reductase-like enzyme
VVEADLVVIGVGVVPNVEWLSSSGLSLDNGLVCGADMHVHGGHIFAAGDVASWPNPHIGQLFRGEQWTTATEQATHAARQLLGTGQPGVPCASSMYFWSDQHGVKVQGVGDPRADFVEILIGSTDSHKFVAGYRRGDRLVAALAMNQPRQFQILRRLVESNGSWESALEAASGKPVEALKT